MGLLDDAIREHLELKRRHGADPGEVARLEHEALGPARASRAAAPWSTSPWRDGRGRRAASTTTPTARGARRGAPRGAVDHAPEPEPSPSRSPSPSAASPPARARAPAESTSPTRQFTLEELEAATARRRTGARPRAPPRRRGRRAADDEPEGEDVLEETPEFLQETPEHDRLWFEQKPPRDFDF